MSAIKDNRSRERPRNGGGTNRERFGVRGPFCPEGAGAPERNARPIKKGPPRVWTEAMIIQGLQYLARELGRTPSARDVVRSEHTPSDALIRLRFGTFNNAIRAAGLTPRVRGGTWRDNRREPDWSNHRWVMPRIDPAKAKAITEQKRRYWQGAA